MISLSFKQYAFISLYFALFPILSAQEVRLTVEGTIQIKKEAGANKILQSDATGWGAWVKPAQQQRKVIDVTDFGAIGDLSTDNTAAFQAAIDSATQFSGTVFIPGGNYILQNELKIPGGVMLQGESQGGDYHSFSTPVRGSCIVYTGTDYVAEFKGFFSGAKDLYFYNGGTAGAKGAGCFKLVANDGHFSTGHNTFSNLYMYNFFEGTCFKIEATSNSKIAHVMVEDVLFRFPETGMHIETATGSTIEHITLLNGKIGGGLKYSFRNQGGTNINVYGTSFEGVACGSLGHIVVESGNINIYGFRTESTDSEGSCDEGEIMMAHFFPNTKGSYIQGLTGDGRVLDEGANYLDVSGRNIERRSSGHNEFQNSTFKGVHNNTIPYWEITGNPSNIQLESPAFESNHQVLTLTIPAGAIISLSPTASVLPKAYAQQFASFGAYLKTDAANVAFCQMNTYVPSTNTCTNIHSTFHTGDDKWQYIGLPASINEATCTINPSYIFDNSGNSSTATVSITTPSFVFGNVRPALTAKPLLTSGGIMDGTLAQGMTLFPIIVTDGTFELTLPFDGNTFLLTGVNPIHRLNNDVDLGPRFPTGTVITLVFESAGVTVRNRAFINLLGTENYVSTAGSSLTLVALDAGVWREIGRNQ